MLLIFTCRNWPGTDPAGPRKRFPKRRKSGEFVTSRIVMFLIVTSSNDPPLTVSSARPAAVIENHVCNGDVFKTAVRFCSEFYSPGWTVTIGRLGHVAFECAVDQRTDIVPGLRRSIRI